MTMFSMPGGIEWLIIVAFSFIVPTLVAMFTWIQIW